MGARVGLRAGLLHRLKQALAGQLASPAFLLTDSAMLVVLSVMMASPTLQTLPVKMWTTLRQDLTPVIAVASTLLIALSVLVMFIAATLRRRNEARSTS